MAPSQDCHPLTFAVFYSLITNPWVQPTLRRKGPYRTCGMPTTYFNICSIFSITKRVFSDITCLIWRFSKSVCELPFLASHSPPAPCLHGRNIHSIRLSRKPPPRPQSDLGGKGAAVGGQGQLGTSRSQRSQRRAATRGSTFEKGSDGPCPERILSAFIFHSHYFFFFHSHCFFS